MLEAWGLSSELHEPRSAASPDELAHAEHSLGRSLPDTVQNLYSVMGGGSFLSGNLNLHPLLPDPSGEESLALTTAADLLRSWEWPVPEDLVVFGDNGAGEQFGLWLPDQEARPLVIEVGQVFDGPGLAIVGDDLERFLLGWTAYYLLLLRDESDTSGAVDALGLPAELQTLDGTDEEFFAILKWANPGLSQPPDPYKHRVTVEKIRETAHAPK